MSGWSEVARLGESGDRYPHVLVDAHGWALRLGPNYRRDDKYFSSLPTLLEGLVEHSLRRRLPLFPADGLEALASEIRSVMSMVRGLASKCLEDLSNETQPMVPDIDRRPLIGFPAPKSASGDR